MGMHPPLLVPIDTVPVTAAPPPLHIQARVRWLLCSLCLLPMLLMLWALFSQLHQLGWNKLPAILSCASIFAACGWLLARIHSLSSIELGREGLAQSFAWHCGQPGRRLELRWEQVQRVVRRGSSYYFTGSNGAVLELNTLLLDAAEDRLQAIRMLMPQRLRAQL